MAQKREKDETDLKLPENFFRASPMPSLPKPSTAEDPISRSPDRVDPPPLDHPIRKVSNADESRSCSSLKSPEIPDLSTPPLTKTSTSPEKSEVKRREINRCSGCRRKVGLTGFRCRCGEMFCREHRYSDRHDCSFDYKAAGREAIARENPLVRASKILKV